MQVSIRLNKTSKKLAGLLAWFLISGKMIEVVKTRVLGFRESRRKFFQMTLFSRQEILVCTYYWTYAWKELWNTFFNRLQCDHYPLSYWRGQINRYYLWTAISANDQFKNPRFSNFADFDTSFKIVGTNNFLLLLKFFF